MRISKIWHRDTKSKCLQKNGTDRLAQCRVATSPQFIKYTSVKHNKKRYDCIMFYFLHILFFFPKSPSMKIPHRFCFSWEAEPSVETSLTIAPMRKKWSYSPLHHTELWHFFTCLPSSLKITLLNETDSVILIFIAPVPRTIGEKGKEEEKKEAGREKRRYWKTREKLI